jgi:hypothetical protein
MKGKDVETEKGIIIAWWTSSQAEISDLRLVASSEGLSEGSSWVESLIIVAASANKTVV